MDVAIGIVISLVLLWVACLVLFWLFRPKGVPVREIVAVIPDVLRLLRGLIIDSAVPWDVRIVLIGLVAWILSPIDLIPEFIPVLGPLDDVVVAIVAFRFVRRRIGIGELERRWPGSPESFALLRRIIGAGTTVAVTEGGDHEPPGLR